MRLSRTGYPGWTGVLLLGAVLGASCGAKAQLPAGTQDADQHQASKQDPRRAQAAAALDRSDFPTALTLLTAMAAEEPKDARLLYDLGYTQESMEKTDAAEGSYKASAAADATFFEPRLALGLLLARTGKLAEAHSVLEEAVKLSPSTEPEFKGRAWRALARIDEQQNPAAARDELLEALKTSPEAGEDTLMSAELAERLGDPAGAEKAYRALLSKKPDDPEATASLAHLLMTEKNTREAEPLLSAALAKQPDDIALNAELADAYVADGKPQEALALAEKLRTAEPDDADVARLYARVETLNGDYAKAEPVWASLAATYPNDPVLLDDRGDALIHLKRFPEAEAVLKRALANPTAFKSKEDLGNAAGHLAFAASEAKDPGTVLQALRFRASVWPPSAPTLFLEATANDQLHRIPEASELYKRFLSAANGKFPDEEWQARHRLLALANMK